MKLLFWCSDFNLHDGEGVLAVKLIKNATLLNKCTSIVITPDVVYRVNYFNNKIIIRSKKNKIWLFGKVGYKKSSFFYKYILPLLGMHYLNSKKFKYNIIYYMNYLPLWNFFIFFLAGSHVRFGPITGSFVGKDYVSDNRKKIINIVIRKYIFQVFYKLSVQIIKNRDNVILWPANRAVYKYLSKIKNIHTVLPPSLMYGFLDSEKGPGCGCKKKYDILVYFRNHPSKNPYKTIGIVKLLALRYKVVVVGDHVSLPKVKSLGYVSQEKIFQLYAQVELVVSCSNEASGIFFMEVASSGTNLLAFEKSGAKLIDIMSNVYLVPELDLQKYLKAANYILSKGKNYKKLDNIVVKNLQNSFDLDLKYFFKFD